MIDRICSVTALLSALFLWGCSAPSTVADDPYGVPEDLVSPYVGLWSCTGDGLIPYAIELDPDGSLTYYEKDGPTYIGVWAVTPYEEFVVVWETGSVGVVWVDEITEDVWRMTGVGNMKITCIPRASVGVAT